MCPMVSMPYSTTMGASGVIEIATTGASDVALVKKFKYRKAKLSSTGSNISISTRSSGLSEVVLCLSMMLPVPRSPEAVKRMPSLVIAIVPENHKNSVNNFQ